MPALKILERVVSRFTYYHNEIKGKIEGDSLFYKSFETDSSGMSLAVLSWRDALGESRVNYA